MIAIVLTTQTDVLHIGRDGDLKKMMRLRQLPTCSTDMTGTLGRRNNITSSGLYSRINNMISCS